MPKWSNIAKLSEHHEKARAAAFEAEMLAMLAPAKPTPCRAEVSTKADASPAPPHRPDSSLDPIHANPDPSPDSPPIFSSVPVTKHDAIHISVTTNGHTTHYPNLHSVPTPLRQQILNTWLATPSRPEPSPDADTPPPTTPPTLITPTTPRAAAPVSNPPPPHSPPQPTTPRPKTLRFALTLNLLIPGAGQLYLGQPLLAAAYGLPFLAIFVATLAIFLRAYTHYLTLATTGDLLEPGNLETLTHAFPAALLTTLTAISTAIYIASTIHLILKRPRPA